MYVPQSVKTSRVGAVERVVVRDRFVVEVNGSQTPVHTKVDGKENQVMAEDINLTSERERERECV